MKRLRKFATLGTMSEVLCNSCYEIFALSTSRRTISDAKINANCIAFRNPSLASILVIINGFEVNEMNFELYILVA